jgi:membrane-associated protease RseP (regulator of RpoE activity)
VVCKGSLDIESAFVTSIGLFGKGTKINQLSSTNSVVLINGDLEDQQPYSDSVVIASGDVKLSVATRTLIIATGKVTIGRPVDCTIRENARTVYDNVAFFSPEMVGLTIAPTDSKLMVRYLANSSPLLKAGMKVGDVLLTIDGKKIESITQLSEVLREKLLDKRAVFSVLRNNIESRIEAEFNKE